MSTLYPGGPRPYPGQAPLGAGNEPLAPAGHDWDDDPSWDFTERMPEPPGYGGAGRRPGDGRPSAKRRTWRTRRRWMLVAIALVVFLAAGGGATYYVLTAHVSGQKSAIASTHGATARKASPSATPEVIHHGDLRRYLIPAPHGSNAWPQPLGTNGKLSLAQAASLSTNSKARSTRLTGDHYVQGAVRSWVTSNGTWFDVRLYQFGSDADARNLFLTDIDASSSGTPVAHQSGVKNVPMARAFADPKPDSAGFVSVLVVGIKGDVVFIVDAAEHSKTPRLGTPDDLMQEQYNKL